MIKFTEENWKKHIAHSNSLIYTARDRPVCFVGHVSVLPDGNKWECSYISPKPVDLDYYCNYCYDREGFESAEELKNELLRIYPAIKKIYFHIFTRISEGDSL